MIDLAPLTNAISRLEEGLPRCDAGEDVSLIRDGVIKRFANAYEAAHKTLRRALEAISPATPYQRVAFAEQVREGHERRILRGDWADWARYREMRTKIRDAYEDEIAIEIVAGIPEFLSEAVFLRDALRHCP